MLQGALQRIQKEVSGNPNDPYVKYIGAELIKYVRANPDQASFFASEKKTIQGSLEAMAKAAEKVKKGNRAMLTPDQGMTVVMEYYGIKQDKPEPTPEPKVIGLNVDLEEMLL